MKILGYEINRIKDAIPAEIKTLTWEKLWGAAREWIFWKGRVTRPYAQVPSVYKAVKAICDNVPQAEIALYRWEDDEEIQDAENELLRLLERPNAKQSSNDFLQELVGHYALKNEVFILKVKGLGNIAGSRQLPAELKVLNPAHMDTIKQNGEITGWRYKNKPYLAEEVIHIKDFNPYDEDRGLDPKEPLGHEMDLDYLASVYNKAFFENDATPNALILSEKSLSTEQRKRLTEWIQKRHQGAENKHKMDVLEGGLDMKTLTPSHKDMEFTEQRKFSREELLGAFRAPKALFNITEDLNYATFQGQMKIFWLYAIMPILRKVEDAINVNLVYPYDRKIYFAFDLKNVPAFQEDFNDKVATAKILFDMGFTGNEINQKLGLGFDDKDWRNFWWVSFGMAPADAESASNYYSETDKPEEDEDPADKSARKIAEVLDKQADIKDLQTWKVFVAKQKTTETLMDRKLSRYFHEQRKRILSAINEQNMLQGPDVINWEEENNQIKTRIAPVMKQAIDDGVAHGQSILGKKSITSLDVKLTSYLADRMAKIVGINTTTRKKLRKDIDEKIAEGGTVEDISETIKDTYNLMASRSKLIARTETVGAVNGGSNIYYQESGVEMKRWLTAGDEHVRESHRVNGAQGAIKIDAAFTNGCRYPGDQDVQDAGEVVNCRCTLMPILE